MTRSPFPSIRSAALLGPPLLATVVVFIGVDRCIAGDAVHAVQDGDEAAAPVPVRVPEGFTVSLVAREPLVKDPVAFAVDPFNRIHVCESFRQSHGIEDNRSSPYWLEDDLAAQTVEDRRAYMLKWADKFEGGARWFTEKEDRIRMLVDDDGDGVADRSEIVADGFNDVVDGTGAGALWWNGDLYYTNIPHLWVIRDTDGDGTPDTRESVYEGFGVRMALRGHDMHGLVLGPDGRLYWSIGDRGYHVTLPDGRVLADPKSGAVFRCELDGSNLEVFATGLRNPQELAFDRFGNLFTGDNNSDGGDRARLVYVVEGGETGWNMSYQTLEGANQRGPWNQEGTWWLERPLDPASTLPPLAHIGAGPAGFVFAPGVGLPERYDDAFFLCDFRGGRGNSLVHTFKLEVDGAGFRVVDLEPFATNVLVTDVDFDWAGRMLVSDWGGGWNSNGTGQIYAITHGERSTDAEVADGAKLVAAGFEHRSSDELCALLAHPDMRIRLRAQYALASRGPATIDRLEALAIAGSNVDARRHAAWALGMQARLGASDRPSFERSPARRLLPLLDDADPEMRAQAARILGEAGITEAIETLRELVVIDEPRVRFFAAIALGHLGARQAMPEIAALLAENEDRDPYLRHAGVMALTLWNDGAILNELAAHPARSVRLGAVLAMRRHGNPQVARLLDDGDALVALEAARAINDEPIRAAWPVLAARIHGEVDRLPEPASSTFEVVREVWRDVDDAGGADLLAHPRFETPATERETLPVFATAGGDGDRYLDRLRATFVAPADGAYVFWITSDDNGVLLLERDGSAPREIARVNGWTNPRAWTTQPGQRSAPVELRAGDRVTLEARHGEGGGGDHVAVGVTHPDGTHERPIGATEPVDPTLVPMLRRVVNTVVRAGTVDDAAALADLASHPGAPEVIRVEAIESLAEWPRPGARDRVVGNWRPVSVRAEQREAWREVLRRGLPGVVATTSGRVRSIAQQLAADEGVALDARVNRALVRDPNAAVEERAVALRQLARVDDEEIDELVAVVLESDDARLRIDARAIAIDRDPESARALVEEALASGDRAERQASIAWLSKIDEAWVIERLRGLVTDLASASLDPALALDVAEAAEAQDDAALERDLAAWRRRLATGDTPAARAAHLQLGGNADRGRLIVQSHAGAQCLRCHAIDGFGGSAGPALDGVARRGDRAYLLESMLAPDRRVLAGYEGSESAMPAMGPILSERELRDVVAYLATLDEERAVGH